MLHLSLLLWGLIGGSVASNIRRVNSRHLMVNGVDTKKGQYPFHTQVGCCSGALIAPDVILAAAHEIPALDVAVGMEVTIGAFYSDPVSNLGRDQHRVAKVFVHPGYTVIHNDFAVLILDKPSKKEPIRINRNSQVPVKYSNVTILGTGTFNLTTSERSVVLQEAIATYLPNDECRESFDPDRGVSYGGDFLDESNMCTSGQGDGCIFDSGGPIMVKEDGSDVLVALISFGVGCADPFYPAVNSRVSMVHEWIDFLVCKYSVNPPEDFKCGTQATDSNTTAQSFEMTAPSSPPSEMQIDTNLPEIETENVSSRVKIVPSLIVLSCAAGLIAIVWKGGQAHGTEAERIQLLSKSINV